MAKFIKNQIVKQGNISKELGQAKYRAYFIDVEIYEIYKEEVDQLLIDEGYEFCISPNHSF